MNLDTIAAQDCYGCQGTGRVVGFNADGHLCPCVATCEVCEAVIAWGHDDERAPAQCEVCRGRGES